MCLVIVLCLLCTTSLYVILLLLVGFCIVFEFNHLKNLLLINIHTIKMQIWRTDVLLMKMMTSGRKNRAEWEVEGPERWRSTWALWKGGGGRGEGRAWLYVKSATVREEKKERGWLTVYAITQLPEAHVYKDEEGVDTRGGTINRQFSSPESLWYHKVHQQPLMG